MVSARSGPQRLNSYRKIVNQTADANGTKDETAAPASRLRRAARAGAHLAAHLDEGEQCDGGGSTTPCCSAGIAAATRWERLPARIGTFIRGTRVLGRP